MSGFLSKLFGSKKQSGGSDIDSLIQEKLEGVIDLAGLDLEF